MEAKKYITKPVEIEAIEWDGFNFTEISEWTNGAFMSKTMSQNSFCATHKVGVETLEGFMEASVGDFIIKGLRGEFYPCKPDVFHKKYQLKEE